MPEIRRYTVRQEREVVVVANSAVEAAQIANSAFEHGQLVDNTIKERPKDIWGNTTGRIRENRLEIEEEPY